jgi:flagellar capping protein FliD
MSIESNMVNMSIESNMVNELDKIVKEITELFKKYNELLVELKKEETVTYGPVIYTTLKGVPY